jgi:hypothetical protein
LIGRRIHGPNWDAFSHYTHDFSDYDIAAEQYCRLAKARHDQQTLDKRETAIGPIGPRISLVKSEDRPFQAAEKDYLLGSPLFDPLDNVVGRCYHREVIGEVERAYYRNLPADHWLRSICFPRTLKAISDRDQMEQLLIIRFEVSPQKVLGLSQVNLESLWKDQVSKKYVTMAKVSF